MVSNILRMVDEDASLLAAIQERVPEPSLRRMRSAPGLAWVPAEPFDRLKQIHFEHVGEDDYVAFWRQYTTQLAVSPLFRRLLEGGKRIFGATPSGVLKWVPRGWAVSTRDCGIPRIDVTETTASLTIEGAPQSSRQVSTGHTSRGSLLGLCDLLSIDATVTVDDSQMDAGRFIMDVRWG